jgi:hypothetical protein
LVVLSLVIWAITDGILIGLKKNKKMRLSVSTPKFKFISIHVFVDSSLIHTSNIFMLGYSFYQPEWVQCFGSSFFMIFTKRSTTIVVGSN